MNYKNIELEKKGKIAYLTINRPKQMNALNGEVLKEIQDAMINIENDENLNVCIITGAGKAFVAGADIAEMSTMTSLDAHNFSLLGHNLMNYIENMGTPVIAVVNGFALGGGCELAMSCDFIIASTNAKFGQPEINLGIIPGFGGTQRLSRSVGKKMANYLIMSGEMISAEEALRIGLVQKLVDHEALVETADKIANNIANKSTIGVSISKNIINKGYNIDMSAASSLESESFAIHFSSEDQKEGMNAFLNKRKPNFINK